MSWTFEHRWKVPAGPARVFAALTVPGELEAWFAERVDVSAGTVGRFRFWGRHTLADRGAEAADQAITLYEKDRLLGFSWRVHGIETDVRLSLETDGADGSELTVRHQVAGPLGVPRERELIEDFWRLSIGNLMAHLAGGAEVLRPDFTDPRPEVRFVMVIAAPPEAVFAALIDPAALAQWFWAPAPVVEPWVGGRYEVGWKYEVDGRDVIGGPTRILELVPNRVLVCDWPDWRGDQSVTGQTIRFELEPVAGGTRLSFVHSGFGRASDIGDYPFGWQGFLDNLKALVLSNSNQ